MNIAALTIIDYGFLFVMIISFLAAVQSGLMTTMLGLTRTLAAGYGSLALSTFLQPLMVSFIPSAWVAKMVASTGLFIILCILLSLVKNALLSAMGPMAKGVFDRSLGALFGFFRGVIMCSVVFLGIALGCSGLNLERNRAGLLEVVYHPEHFPEILAESQSTNLLKMSCKLILNALPRSVLEELFSLNQTIRSQFATGFEDAIMPSSSPAVAPKPAAPPARSEDAIDSSPPESEATSTVPASNSGMSNSIQQLKSLMGDVLQGTMENTGAVAPK